MPHRLFAGPAGTGKTTALCLANNLFGKRFGDNFFELDTKTVQYLTKEYFYVSRTGIPLLERYFLTSRIL